MVDLTKSEIVSLLIGRGAAPDRAVMYADAFVEYREASANVDKHGPVVTHPRTQNPIVNPCLAIRERAMSRLLGLRGVSADPLWL